MQSGESISTGTRTILVVDDEPGVRSLLSDVLTEEGYAVMLASDGKKAWDVLSSRAGLDMVITDLVMPNQEGIETIRAIRARFPQVKIIAMSGAFGGKFLRMAKGLGADATLHKPVAPGDLLRTVAGLLATFC